MAFARAGTRADWTELALPDGLHARTVDADGAGATWATGLKYGTAGGIPTGRYRGGRWQLQDAPAPERSLAAGINAVASAGGPDDVCAVGYCQPDDVLTFLGLIEHWNGTAWERVDGPRIDSDYWTLRDVVATGPSDVWAVGGIGTPEGWSRPLLLHVDGRGWNEVAAPDPDSRFGELTQVVAVGPDDIRASGTDTGMSRTDDHALVVHYDGRGRTRQETGIGAGRPNGLTRTAGGVAVVGAVYADGRFRPVGARSTALGWQPQGTAPDGRIPRAVMEVGGRLTVVGIDLSGHDGNGEPLPSTPFSVTR
ncbi:hypothetical protein ACFV1L_18070 [Kitasatospora sp. NPDC059646]|uniref:hypothetical protein n=1 Tax=Kitasatospora sp. NPDC059646 TaxID=3346893 RepID=UPI0036919F92